MTIDRSFIESELASVRAQQQQAAAIIQQMLGAEKTLMGLLDQLDREIDEAKQADDHLQALAQANLSRKPKPSKGEPK
jgi:hypothetical protein